MAQLSGIALARLEAKMVLKMLLELNAVSK
jgi:hypothetical protein